MKINTLAIASVVSLALLAAGSAQATGTAQVIAGWDFSQCKVPGSSTGCTSPLAANYSFFDPNGAGLESALNGSATYTGPLLPTGGHGLNCERLPNASGPPGRTNPGAAKGCASPNVNGPIRSNSYEAFELGKASFDAFSILLSEGGQSFANRYAMKADGAVSITFMAFAPGTAEDWKLSFGGKVLSGNSAEGAQTDCAAPCESTVTVDFSTDGINFDPKASQTLTVEDQRFEVDLDTVTSTMAYVRLGLSPSQGQPVIDNVAIEAIPLPEPTLAMQLMAGIAGLLALGRLRG